MASLIFPRLAALSTDNRIVHLSSGAFSISSDTIESCVLQVIVHAASADRATVLWSRQFDDLADRDAVIDQFRSGVLDLAFHSRVTMIWSSATMDAAVDQAVVIARAHRREQEQVEAQRRIDAKVIDLHVRQTKHGYSLELQRKSDRSAEWSVQYDRAAERDRLCDWLKWQKPRFASFLAYSAEHGSEALARALLDEMFATERQVKKEGRGAGGLRPLRMWRSGA